MTDQARDRVRNVGRVGELDLHYVRRGRQTILAQFRSSSPWHLLPPIRLEDSGSAYTLLLNPSGGLVGGDHLSVRATLGPGTHVLFSSPSANRVYRSASEPSRQSVEIIVGPDAILEWVPELTIPFAGSRFHQTIRVTLGRGATALLWDAIASGRIARGERWAFASLDNTIDIATTGSSVLERYCLSRLQEEAENDADLGLATDWDYVASLFVVNDALTDEVWKRLGQTVGEILDEDASRVLGGVSEPAVPGMVVKLVARSAPDLTTTFERLWGAVREELWGLSVPPLRRY